MPKHHNPPARRYDIELHRADDPETTQTVEIVAHSLHGAIDLAERANPMWVADFVLDRIAIIGRCIACRTIVTERDTLGTGRRHANGQIVCETCDT